MGYRKSFMRYNIDYQDLEFRLNLDMRTGFKGFVPLLGEYYFKVDFDGVLQLHPFLFQPK